LPIVLVEMALIALASRFPEQKSNPPPVTLRRLTFPFRDRVLGRPGQGIPNAQSQAAAIN